MSLRKILVSTAYALALLFLSQLGLGRAEANTSSPVGSWQFSLAPAAGSPHAQPIAGLITFISDGTVVEDDLGELTSAPSATGTSTLHSTSGHGIWQPSPAVGNLFVQVISLVANPDGSLRAKKTLTMTIALNAAGDRFRGGFNLEIQDPTGHAIAMTSGSCAGQLIPHPLLP
jgi:hypothetical protein